MGFLDLFKNKNKTATEAIIEDEENIYTPGYVIDDEETKIFFRYHKKERKIVENVRGKKELQSWELSNLMKSGIIALFKFFTTRDKEKSSWIVLTKNMVYLYNGITEKEEFYFVPNLKDFVERLYGNVVTRTLYHEKKSSVIGSAVAGGIIAGGTGAIIGAASAMNKKPKYVKGSSYDTNDIELCVKGIFGDEGECVFSVTALTYYFGERLDGNIPIREKWHTHYTSHIYNEKFDRFINKFKYNCENFDADYLKKQAKKSAEKEKTVICEESD